ncbi:hypothetical protein [Streptomyces sp. NPDC002156]
MAAGILLSRLTGGTPADLFDGGGRGSSSPPSPCPERSPLPRSFCRERMPPGSGRTHR